MGPAKFQVSLKIRPTSLKKVMQNMFYLETQELNTLHYPEHATHQKNTPTRSLLELQTFE